MNTKEDDVRLIAILKIGHDTAARGEGLSLSNALIRAQYGDLRRSFGSKELLELIKEYPELVEEWVAYSEDKRTSGGWYLLQKGEIGQVGNPASRIHFDSLAESVAYVIRELDFWANL